MVAPWQHWLPQWAGDAPLTEEQIYDFFKLESHIYVK